MTCWSRGHFLPLVQAFIDRVLIAGTNPLFSLQGRHGPLLPAALRNRVAEEISLGGEAARLSGLCKLRLRLIRVAGKEEGLPVPELECRADLQRFQPPQLPAGLGLLLAACKIGMEGDQRVRLAERLIAPAGGQSPASGWRRPAAA